MSEYGHIHFIMLNVTRANEKQFKDNQPLQNNPHQKYGNTG